MNWNRASQFENPPAGSHIGRCFMIVDLGTQPKVNKVTGEKWQQREVRVVFELPSLLMEGRYDEKLKGKPFACSWSGKQSLHPSSKLYKLLKGWGGKEMSPEDRASFNPKQLIGKVARLNLIENDAFINIDSLSKVTPAERDACPKAINAPVFFSLEESEFDHKVLDALPKRTKETIMKSPEYRRMTGDLPPEQEQPGEPGDIRPGEDESNEPF